MVSDEIKTRTVFLNCTNAIKFKEIKLCHFVLFLDMCIHTDKMLLEVQNKVKFIAFSTDICLILVHWNYNTFSKIGPLALYYLSKSKIIGNYGVQIRVVLKVRYKPAVHKCCLQWLYCAPAETEQEKILVTVRQTNLFTLTLRPCSIMLKPVSVS